MLYRLLAVLLCAVSLTACNSVGATKESEKSKDLTVISYNIRAGLGLKGTWSGFDPKENVAGIADFLEAKGADVVLLQEVDMGTPRTKEVMEAEEIAKSMGFHHVFAPTIPLGKGHFGIAVLSRWPILESEAIQLYKPDYSKTHPEYPNYFSEQRVALVAKVDAPGGPITFIDTHLGLTPDQREKQLARIAEVVDAHTGQPIVFAGDLNAKPDEATISPIRERLTDSYTVKGAAEPLSFPSDKPNTCIDYVFSSADHFTPLSWEIPETTLSDHRPLMVKLARK